MLLNSYPFKNPNLFSFEGRLNRAKYFWTMLVIGIVATVVIAIWPSSTNAIVILAPIAGFFPVIKRLHDINKSGGFALLMFFPPLNLILGVVLLFMRGTIGLNQYGGDPLSGNNEMKQDLGRYQDTIESYKQAIRINPDYAETYYNLGAAYLRVGDKGSALEEYKILKTLDTEKANELFNLIYK
jgi:uncharacterized membrane protein YhaH (DUF805 family)